MSKPKSEYEELRDTWYAKLRADGFRDIEQGETSATRAVSKSYLKLDDAYRQSVQDYYCLTTHFLNDYKFDSEIEKVMWEYYSEGLSMRNIAKILQKTVDTKYNKENVWKAVSRLEKIMRSLYLYGDDIQVYGPGKRLKS